MAGNSTIVVRVLGNTRGLSKSLKKANESLGGLDRTAQGITSSMRVAAIAVAGVGIAAVGAGAIGALALAAIPAALIGLGILAAAQSEQVKTAFSGLSEHVTAKMKEIAKPLEPVLVAGAAKIQAAFDKLAPYLEKVFQLAAPALGRMFDLLGPLADKLGPMLLTTFEKGLPVLEAFVQGLSPIVDGLAGFFNNLDTGTFTAFVSALMTGIGGLLPPLGKMLTALTPIGTALLETLLPALADLFTWVAEKLAPAIQDLTKWMGEHQSIVIGVAAVLGGLVLVVKGMQLAMSLASAAMVIYNGVVGTISAATKVWTAIQTAFNVVMALNPVTLVVIAIVALIAAVVLAYQKVDWFRTGVDKAWAFIKTAAKTFWDWLTTTIGDAVTKISGWFTSISTFFTDLPGKITGFVTGAGTWLVDAGKKVVQGFIDGLTGMFGTVKDKLSELTSFLPDWKGPAQRDKTLLTPAGKLIMKGLINGFDKSMPAVRKSLAVVTREIGDYGFTAGGTTRLKVDRVSLAQAAQGGGGANTYNITVQAPVGSSSADIGRELTKYLAAFEKAGGRRRA